MELIFYAKLKPNVNDVDRMNTLFEKMMNSYNSIINDNTINDEYNYNIAKFSEFLSKFSTSKEVYRFNNNELWFKKYLGIKKDTDMKTSVQVSKIELLNIQKNKLKGGNELDERLSDIIDQIINEVDFDRYVLYYNYFNF